MFWEEKVEQLKKETAPADFKVPFTNWSTILKKIEDKFVVKQNSNYRFSNWNDRLKDKRKINTFLAANIDAEVDRLDVHQNYWFVLTSDKADFKNFVYDCKPVVITKLYGLWRGDFCIVEKKYKWLAYFKSQNGNIEVFKSGESPTPFDGM